MEDFLAGFIIGGIILSLLVGGCCKTSHWAEVDGMRKEALERGYMEKQINSEDRVIYVWKDGK